MIHRWVAPAWCLLGLSMGAEAGGATLPDPLRTCDALVASKAEDRGAWRCYYDQARAHGLWQPARERLEPVVDGDPGNVWAAWALANIAHDTGAADAVERLQAVATGLAEKGLDRDAVLARLNLMGVMRRRGDLDRAQVELDVAATLAARSADAELEAIVQIEQARFELGSGKRLAHAEQLLDQAELVVFPEGNYQARLNLLQARVRIAAARGQHELRLALLDRIDALARTQGDLFVAAVTGYNGALARLDAFEVTARPNVEDFRIRLDRAHETALSAGHESAETAISCLRGELFPDEGRTELRACLERSRKGSDHQELTQHLLGLAASLSREDGHDEEIAALLREARALAERQRSPTLDASLAVVEAGIAWRRRDLAVARSQTEAALAAIEASTAEGETRDWTYAHRRFAGEILRTVADRQEAARAALDVLERMRATATRSLLADETPMRTIGLDELSASLGRDEVVLVYSLANETKLDGLFGGGSWVIVVTRETTEIHGLPELRALAGRLEAFASAFSARDGSERAAAASLYDVLLAGPLERLGPGIQRLIIVADRELHGAPFAALGRDTPLAQRYELAFTTSATVLAAARLRPSDASRSSIAVLADPTVPPSMRDSGLPPLAGARAEAEMLVELFGSATSVRSGDEATEAAVLRLAEEAAILHFAAHARIGWTRDEPSALVLAADPPAGDGLLIGPEIAEMDLRDRLVVLAACSSATGTRVAGQGLDGLSWAFQRAGASAIVATLWPVRDDEAQVLMTSFYGALARGEAVGSALAMAQREAIHSGLPAEAWAGFVLLGDPSARPLPQPSSPQTSTSWPWLGALGVLLLGSGLVGVRRRKS